MTDEKKTVSVLVDGNDNIKYKSALPDFGNVVNKAVDISTEILQKNIDSTLKQVFSILENSQLESETHEINEIGFNLSINSSGEVSIASVVKGNLSGQAGLSFKITRKQP